MARQDFSGYTDNCHTISNIVNHGSAGTHCDMRANIDRLPHAGTNPDPTQTANTYGPSYPCAWTDMNTIIQNTIVINTATRIQNGSIANRNSGIHNNPCKSYYPSPELGVSTDRR